MTDMINHPPHYLKGDPTYETIKVIEAWGLDFCLGNAIKYISRAGKKGDAVEDLKKARWYLTREIERLEVHSDSQEESIPPGSNGKRQRATVGWRP